MTFKKPAANRTKALKALLLAFLMILSCACANTAREIDFSDEETARKFAQKHLELYQALENVETDDEKIISMTPEELKAADFADCTAAVIDKYQQKIYERLTEEKTKEFAEWLTQTDISAEESNVEYPDRNGGPPPCQIQITLNTGDVIFIGVFSIREREEGYIAGGDNDYIIINGEHSYQCDKETANKIRDYRSEAYTRFEDYVRASFAEG